MDVREVLRKIGGDQLVDAVRAALSGSEDVVEAALDEGIELKFAEGVVPEVQVAEPEPAPESQAQLQDDTEQDATEKSARTFARQIEELASDAGERDAELLRALAVVVRRADPEQFGALAAILRKVRGKAIQEDIDRIAAKMEQESGIGYAYPEPEEKSQSDAAVAELRAQLDELRRVLDELRQKSAAVSPAAVSLTRQPAPAAHLLYRSLVRNS